VTSAIHRKPAGSPKNKPKTLRYGEIFDEYLITGFAGKGATSFVYQARPIDSFSQVAIKVMHPHLVADPTKRRKFYREARIMMRMKHRNIVRFREIIDRDGVLAYVMEFIDGVTLEEWMKTEARHVEESILARLFVDILRGLSHAHKHGVVHRDLKPANILIAEQDGRYQAKIIDFGLARFLDQPLTKDEKSKIAGTAAYISPEEVKDPDTVCESSDIYSIGVMMYEAATGARPFDDENPRDMLDAHVERNPERPRDKNPGLTPQFEDVIMRTLDKQPDRRYDSAPEMIRALEVALQEAMQEQMRVHAMENAQTTEWSRPAEGREDARSAMMFVYFMTALRAMFTVFASTGAENTKSDAHFLNRVDDVNLPMG
jgi:serine/threonine-protein kinase